VRRWSWPSAAATPPPARAGESDLGRLTAAIDDHATATGARPPHRPWRPPLPDRITVPDLPHASSPTERSATLLRLGLIDLPDTQTQRSLELDLADGGTWLAVGGARSGRSTLLRSVLREAVSQLGQDDLHVHVLESGGGSLAEEAAALPHVGTVISGEDRLRTVRLVERLGQEIAARRARTGAGTFPLILLLIDGVEELTTVVEEADPGHGSAALARLLRDGGAVGLTCVVTADRAVPGGRLAGLARQRLVLPLPDRADYAIAGVPPRAVPGHRPPGRALLGEEALECQLAVPRSRGEAVTESTGGPAPLVIPELPADPALPVPSARSATSRGSDLPLLPVGPGGDEGRTLLVDLVRTGGLLVAGPAGSGRTAALDAFARHLRATGTPLLRLGRPPAAGGPPPRKADSSWLLPSDEAGVRAWVIGLAGRPGVVIADDVGTPAEFPALNGLTDPAARVVLLAASHAAQLSAHYQGPVAALRRARVGLLLCPGPGDADLLGVRLPRTPVPVRPGSGWLVTGGTAQRVQVARRRDREVESG
jgi:S-DNA-T family DNA segregation ATPase FtsK/SpoIIIE